MIKDENLLSAKRTWKGSFLGMTIGYSRGTKKVKDPVKVELQAVDEDWEDLGLEGADLIGKDKLTTQMIKSTREVNIKE